MNNGRFATSLHILTLLGDAKGELVSSEYLAGSININPAIVRKEIKNLKEHGLVESKEGKGGGTTLAKKAKDISLADILFAVKNESLFGRTNDTNPACRIGKQINKKIEVLFDEAETAVMNKMGKISLADFIKQFS